MAGKTFKLGAKHAPKMCVFRWFLYAAWRKTTTRTLQNTAQPCVMFAHFRTPPGAKQHIERSQTGVPKLHFSQKSWVLRTCFGAFPCIYWQNSSYTSNDHDSRLYWSLECQECLEVFFMCQMCQASDLQASTVPILIIFCRPGSDASHPRHCSALLK